MSVSEHLDPESLYDLAEGRLGAERERAAEAHLLRCASCRSLREDCAAMVGALRWYGQRGPAPSREYWADFWSRWPLAGDVPLARRSRWAPSVAVAATVLLAVGLWWVVERPPVETPERLSSPSLVSVAPSTLPPARELVAGTTWEEDIEMLERVTFAVGSIDPLSKGVALTSLAERP